MGSNLPLLSIAHSVSSYPHHITTYASTEVTAPLIVDRSIESLTSNWGNTWRYLVSDEQVRWMGPERCAKHSALSAVINALWNLWAKTQHKPV